MAWVYGEFSCGHSGDINVPGTSKGRQERADYMFARRVCDKCWEEQRVAEMEKANAEAAKQAEEMDLPELTGTEKQVAWANTLRQKRIEQIQEKIEDDSDRKKEECIKALDFMIRDKTAASWYIDNREYTVSYLLKTLVKEMPTDEELAEKKIEQEIKAEATVYPKETIASGIVDIKIKADRVSAHYIKNEDFREIVKELGYRWQNGGWEKRTSETTGSGIDRAAELGNMLLNSGFPICILDAEARQRAIEGTFEPEHTRWIYSITGGDYKGWLGIRWQGMDTRLYNVARRLPGSRYVSPYVMVKPDFYRELEEFAELYEFRFTTGAQRAIEQHKQAMQKATVIDPVEVEKEEYKDGLEAILESSREVLDDLLDV